MPRQTMVAVGSRNPVKLRAVAEVLREVAPGHSVTGVSVESGVAEQPRSADEAVRGAVNRATRSMRNVGAPIGIGIEAGVEEVEGRLFVCTWAAVVTSAGDEGIGASVRVEIPPAVGAEIDAGQTLETAVERVMGIMGAGSAQGAVGILTDGYLDREAVTRQAVRLAYLAAAPRSTPSRP